MIDKNHKDLLVLPQQQKNPNLADIGTNLKKTESIEKACYTR